MKNMKPPNRKNVRNIVLSNGSKLNTTNNLQQQQLQKLLYQKLIQQKINQQRIIQQQQPPQQPPQPQQQPQQPPQQPPQPQPQQIHNLDLKDINESKICIIYTYYEQQNEQKNQQNLSFFIKYGLNEKKWKHLNITYIFVINGYQCEIQIPKKDNIHVIFEVKNDNYNSWYEGIQYIENKNNSPIWKQYDYLCLLNASTNGPFMDEDTTSHWLDPFYNKMVKCDAVACSPYINTFDKYNPNPGHSLSCHFTLIKINEFIIHLLLNTQVESIYSNSKCNRNEIPFYYNTVIGPKKSKHDEILTGECGLSRILLLNNYNICCLYYPNKFNINTNILNENNREEFYHKNNDNLKNTVFIKNIWKTDQEHNSLPVLNYYCNQFIYNKLNQECIYDNLPIEYNYDLLKINNSKFINNKSYYKVYGNAENLILFPKTNNNNINCVIYSHNDSNNIIADYVIQGIKTLIYLGYDILFYTSCTSLYNIDLSTLPFNINFIKNNDNKNYCQGWLDGLHHISIQNKYEWILLLNDSILFPIHGIIPFQNTINEMRKNVDFWGHCISNDINDFPIEIKNNLIPDLIDFISNNMNDYLENNIIRFLVDKNFKYNSVININQCFYSQNIFSIKRKNLNKNYVSKELNYLTRFLYE
jgi:hypothetical protein